MTSEEAGEGARGPSRYLGSSAHQEGSEAAPQPRPPAGDLGSGDPFEEGELRTTNALPESRAAPRLSPYLPSAAGAAHHLPRALTQTRGTANLQNRAAQELLAGPDGWCRIPGFLSLPNFPPSFSFFPVALCVSLQVSLYCTLCLQSHTRSRDTTSPGTAPRGRKGWVGAKGAEWGGGSRLQLHSRYNVEAVGAREVLQRHFAN